MQGLIDSSLAGFTPSDVPKQHFAGTNLNAARPTYAGPIIWLVTVEGFPANMIAGDSVFKVATEPAPIPDVTIFADDFNRADGAIHGTTTPIGGLSWTVTNGTSSVVSNQLGVTTVTTDSVNSVVNAGQSDGVYTATLAAPGTDSAMTLLFRYVDTNNYLSMTRISSANKSWRITKRVAGTVTMIHETSHLIAAGDVLEVTLAGTTVTVKIAGVQVYAGTIAEHAAATRSGFRGQADGHRWDNVSFVVPGG